MKAVYLIAALDTKGREAEFVRDVLKAQGVATMIVDVGCLGENTLTAGIIREAVFEAAGTTRAYLVARNDRGVAVAAAATGRREACGRGV